MTDRNIIGQKIAELRKNKGMTQAELADKLGVSHQAVSQWERSETLPDILTLPQIAEIFGENIAALLGIEEVKTEPEPIPVDIDKLMDEGEKADNSYTRLDANKFSLPESDVTIDLEKDSDYEVAVIQDGRIIKKFRGNPDDHLKIYLVGDCRDLHSEMSVDVQGDVGGNAQSGFGMTIGGDVGGNATSGFEMKCGNVGGNANAGFDLHCGSIGGKASGGFGITKNKGETISGESDAEFSVDGMNVTIEGDYDGDLSTAANVTVYGNISGDVDCSNLTVEGDIEGDVDAGGNVTVEGGDIGGDVDAGNNVTVDGGDISGDVDAGNNVTVEGGDINGDISTTGDVNVSGDVNGDIHGKSITVEGDYNG